MAEEEVVRLQGALEVTFHKLLVGICRILLQFIIVGFSRHNRLGKYCKHNLSFIRVLDFVNIFLQFVIVGFVQARQLEWEAAQVEEEEGREGFVAS